jgi:hypothetical protein
MSGAPINAHRTK